MGADDPVLPPGQVEASKEALDKYNTTLSSVEGAFQTMATQAQNAMNGILNYSKSVIAAGNANASTTALTKAHAETFSLITTQIIGASEAYKGLNALNSRTFDSQLTSLWKTVSNGKNTFSDVAGVATSVAKTLGLPFDKVQEAMSKAGGSGTALKALIGGQISTFAQSADNVVKLRDTYFQLMGASGGLGAALVRSGPNLKNVNLLVQEQMDKINGATKATGLAKEDIVKYYAELGKIPGALNEQIKTTQAAGGTLDGLTARTRLAAATGRSFTDVTNDAKVALHTYNLTGAEALTFVSRMTELSGKFGMELEDTKGFMNSTANAFKFIGNEAEGSARMFNKLMTSFKETGLSAKASTELIQGITNQIGKLSIAQKSFLSSQTGGSGGLMGGFQIEKMLREGKIDEVFDKMQGQMKRQFGKIVSIDDAANSPQAAAQLVRQREMLKQGPLGQFAQTDDQAQRILDAMSKGDKIDLKELSKPADLLNKNLETGKSWQDKTYSVFTSMDATLESIRDNGALVATRLMEKTVTGAAEGKAGANIRNTIRAGQKEGATQANKAIKRETRGGRPVDVTAVNVASDIRQGGREIRTLPSVGQAGIDQVRTLGSTTAQQEKRTGVAPADDAAKHSGDYMDLFKKGKRTDADIQRWTAAQNGPEEQARLSGARTVGAVNTTTPAAAQATERTRAGTGRRSDSIKVDPITVNVVVTDPSGKKVEHTQHVKAGMNTPKGGESP